MIYHCEYFGYNSLLTQHGTRIRRLRRTEASAEKIAYARIRSPPITSQQYINHGYIRENRSSEVQHSHTNSRSKLSFRFVTGPHINNGPSKEESSRQEISRGNPNGLESQNCSSYRPETQSKQSIKDSVAQYYLKNSTTQNIHSKSKRGLRRLQSHDSSTQSVRRTLTNNRPKPLQQSQQLCKTSNLPYIPRCINKQLLQNQKAAAHKRKLQQIQASMKSSIYNQVQSRKASKKMSSMNGSVVSRSSCVSKSAKEENLSVEDNYRDSKNESQVNEYSQLASDYGLEKSRLNNLKHFPQIPVYLSRKDLKSSQQSMLSKKSSNEVSKMDISVKKLNMELSHLSQIKSHSKLSKLSNQVEVQCQVKQKTANDKLQKCHKTDQSYKTNETDKHLVFDFNRTNSKPHEKITMSGSKRLSNKQKVILTSQKEKRSIKFNPQTKAATHQYISTPQKHSTSSKISQQSLTSSVKSGKQKQNRSSMANKLSTLSTLLKQIEQHQMRLGFIYLFIDNTEQTYKGGLQFQRYERLCFLMFKKYLFEMNRIVVALRGGPNCFTLSGIQVKAERLHSYINSSLFSDKINDCLDQIQQLYKKLEIESHRISKKYNKDKLIRLQYTKDNFTQQIVKLLMQELTKLYQELQSEQMQHKQVEETQKRITEIIEIMFLLSELKGRKVKNFELLSQHSIDFNDYYALHYQKIIETHQFFQKLNE